MIFQLFFELAHLYFAVLAREGADKVNYADAGPPDCPRY
jgi:hypothetical protein